MSVLSLENAVRLYKLLEFFLPEAQSDQSVLEFVSVIVYNIRMTNQHSVYLAAIALMQDTTVENIIETYSPEESVAEFARGLQENQILKLRAFCNEMGI